jgi:hypothetical protein
MAWLANMPKSTSEGFSILELVKTLLVGALGWSSDELALTRLDAKAMLNRILLGVVLFFASFAVLTAAIFTLAETLIGALADYLHGNLIAGVLVSAGLFCVTGILMAIGYFSIKAKPKARGMVFRKLLGSKTIG